MDNVKFYIIPIYTVLVEFDIVIDNLDSFYKYFNTLREENVNSEQNNTDK